ncbi:30S ribosomal protein S16 [Candidatus Sumerlaeota bacterium]|nr:30S ribosomal protein S16 [Candidatus Sumerlaeota bacterium]
MSVKIRLTRTGRKKSPYFRVVVADSRNQRDGRFLEILGYYHPIKKEGQDQCIVNEDKALMWLSQGARPSDTVRSLLSKLGIMKKFHELKLQNKVTNKQIEETPKPEVTENKQVL